ncbi:hypothetical protein BH09VER1_BH09VER1_16930 [soil metagenome]
MKSSTEYQSISRRPAGRAGFTLIELLVSIGIIAVLTTLLFAAFPSVQRSVNNVRCVSNLKQIGTGLAMYCTENNNMLPGPLLPSQGPRYNTVTGPYGGPYAAYLADYLFPFLSIPTPSSGGLPTLVDARHMAPMFYCPEFANFAKDGFANPYFIRWKITGMGNMPPWGSYGTTTPQYPINLLTIPNRSLNWAICDLDQKSPDLPSQSWYSSIPTAPIHPGGLRNALFFDWHVAKIDDQGTPR